MRCLLLVLACVGCAKAGGGSGDPSDAATSDGPGDRVDAPDQHTDAPAGSCAMPFTGMLVTWNLTGQTGSQTVTPPTSSAQGLTVGSLMRSSALTAVSGANSMNASNWPTTATRDATKYFTFTLAPPSGCSLSVTSLSIDAKASATGPATAVAASSADTYTATATVSTSAPSTPSMTVANSTSMVEIRVYGYSASSTSGTLRIENTFVVNGSIQ